MTKTKSTKRALLSSVLALLLCVAMLVGTTYAWFTDSVVSGRNIIQSGNLDMKVSYKPYGAENTAWTEVTSETAIFDDAALYEPGYTEAVWLKVENAGSLAFKYNLALNVYSEKAGINKDGKEFKLSDHLTVKAMTTTSTEMESGFYTTRESLDSFAWGLAGSVETSLSNQNIVVSDGVAFSKNDTTMSDSDSMYVLVVIQMPTTVGNEANHNGTDIPEINLAVNAVATQLAHESDSFGSDYDKDADYVAYFTSGTHELNTTLMATKATDVITATGADTVVNITGGYYDAGDQDCAVWAKDGATVNIYDGTFTHNGDGTEVTSAHHYDMIYAGANGGKINIYGGFFSARDKGVWLLNEKDNQGTIVVYGGTFVNWNPADNDSEGKNTDFVAQGYEVTEQPQANGDIWYVVDKQYNRVSTVEELKNALTTGGDILLTTSVTVMENLSVSADSNLYGSADTVMNFENNGKVTVAANTTLGIYGMEMDANGEYSFNADGSIVYDADARRTTPLLNAGAGSTLILGEATVIENVVAKGPAVISSAGTADNRAKVILDGATVQNCAGESGTIINVDKASDVVIEDGTVISNNASYNNNNHGIIRVYNAWDATNPSTVTMNGGEINGNHYSGNGMIGLYYGKFIMNGGEIKDNAWFSDNQKHNGFYPVVYVHSNSQFVMNGGEISGNSVKYGVLNCLNSAIEPAITINGGTVINNINTINNTDAFAAVVIKDDKGTVYRSVSVSEDANVSGTVWDYYTTYYTLENYFAKIN